MKRTLALLFAGIVALAGLEAPAAHTRATLHLETATAKPGETIWAAVRLQMDPEWHTYWKNAGEGGLGIPTKIVWKLPPGVTAGPIEWPVPEKLPADDATTYIFHDEAALLIPLTLASDLKPGTLELAGEVRWMECKTACIPGKTNISAKLQIGDYPAFSTDAPLFTEWRKRVPTPAPTDLRPSASWEKPATGDKRPLLIEWTFASPVDSADFYPAPADDFDVSGATETLNDGPGKIRLRKAVQKFEGDWPKEIAGLLVMKTGTNTTALDASFPIGGASGPEAITEPASEAPTKDTPSFLRMLIYAFIGGLILNIMPCVFPVIALKILGFVQQSHDEPGRIFKLGLIYGLGVIVSFLVMAGLVIAIQLAGGSASWGMQFKSPQVSVGFIALVVLIALNLFGVFEVTLGSGTMNAAGQLASRSGPGGAFFHGVLATVLATPCTAPILAPALGFAFSQPPLGVLLFFLLIGLGLAFPYVLLSWRPAWLKFLPRPGVWMEQFKKAMGFPMLATAVWILWFTAPRFGEDGIIWIGFFLIGLSFAAWIWGDFVQRGGNRRGLAIVTCLLVLGISYGYALETKLRWRSPVAASSVGTLPASPDGVPWQPWSLDAVQEAREAGRPVLVDFTAKWCVTCNTAVKPVVDNLQVRQKLEAINGVALLADYSNWPADMEVEIKKYRPDGAIPLVLVYSRDASQPPEVLPTIPTRKGVLDALDRAAQ